MSQHNTIGRIGEEIAAKWLSDRGYTIIDRNYLKKWGEIDIVARETKGSLHFVEVKTVSYETKLELERDISRETWRPEEKVTKQKLSRMQRAIETWLLENKEQHEFQIDVLSVKVVPREKYAVLKLIDNVILE